jgi:dipeptidyl aminopeptidase/acylaminoacyl peptidase
VHSGGSKVSYAGPGYLIYARRQTLMAQRFNAQSLQLTGAPAPIVEQVGQVSVIGIPVPGAMYSSSQNGVLTYRASNSGRVQLAWYDRVGRHLSSIGEPGYYPQIALSPDDTRLAVERVDGETRNLWILELASGIFSRLTFSAAGDYNPVWSPDGRALVFSAVNNGYQDLHRKALGGGEDEVVYHSAQDKGPYNWSKDGRILFNAGRDFFQVPLAGERSPTPLLQSQFGKDLATVSRDGRWVAYQSTESFRWEVYVARFPSFSDRRQVSVSGGCQPLWNKDGTELFYVTLDAKLAAVAVKTGTGLETGTPHTLFQAPIRVNPNQTEYCVTGDGKRFIFREPVEASAQPITVVLNWAAGLKK